MLTLSLTAKRYIHRSSCLDIASSSFDQKRIDQHTAILSVGTNVLYLPPLTAAHDDEKKMLQHKKQLIEEFRINPPRTRNLGIEPIDQEPVILNDDDRFALEVAVVETDGDEKFYAGRFVYDIVGERWVRIAICGSSSGRPYKTADGAGRKPFDYFRRARKLRMKAYMKANGKPFISESLPSVKLTAEREKWMTPVASSFR